VDRFVFNPDIVKRDVYVLFRGLLSRSVLQAQSASPIFTHVYSAVVAIINSKFPQIGELMLKRLVLSFRKGYRRNDKVLGWLPLGRVRLLA
jgi:Na+/pantothenate symporter